MNEWDIFNSRFYFSPIPNSWTNKKLDGTLTSLNSSPFMPGYIIHPCAPMYLIELPQPANLHVRLIRPRRRPDYILNFCLIPGTHRVSSVSELLPQFIGPFVPYSDISREGKVSAGSYVCVILTYEQVTTSRQYTLSIDSDCPSFTFIELDPTF